MIRCENLSYSYDNEDKIDFVFENLNIEIKKGEFLSVLGHNGSGKSTLAKLFNGVLLPSGGKVFVLDMDTAEEKDVYSIRQNVGMVFQNPDNQIVATVVEEDVAFGPENLGVPPSEIRERVNAALYAVDMLDKKSQAPHLLSGGQKQRIAIAGIIAMRPACIVLDEPTAMLDPLGRKEVMNTILDLNKNHGITIILITHYMEEAALADRVLVMDKGTIIMDGKPSEVLIKQDELKAVRLDVPQVTELMHLLKNEGLNVNDNIIDVDSCTKELLRLLQTGGAAKQ
jgi:energy-coupling factor transport system ATP-binding protein